MLNLSQRKRETLRDCEEKKMPHFVTMRSTRGRWHFVYQVLAISRQNFHFLSYSVVSFLRAADESQDYQVGRARTAGRSGARADAAGAPSRSCQV